MPTARGMDTAEGLSSHAVVVEARCRGKELGEGHEDC